MLKNIRVTLYIILFLLIASIVAAYFIEYGMGHKPCRLCLYQRIPYFVSLVLILNFLFLKKLEKTSLLLLSIVMLVSLVLAFYHFGIEQGFFSESFVCESDNLSKEMTKEELLKQLSKNTVSCKDVGFTLFGFSLSSINAIFSFILFYIFIRLYKNYEINR